MTHAEELEMFRTALRIADLNPSEVALPTDHQMIVGAMRFHYLDWGGSGTPILFLHGGGLTAHTWDCVALMLRDRYRCIALDQRGHGDSEWSPAVDYRIASHLGDIEGFVAALGLQRPILVGQSMGGLNSIAYATRYSDAMRAMVIVDVGPEVSAAGAERIRDFASTPELDSPDEFLARAVKFNSLRDPAVLRRSLHYNLRQAPNGKWGFKHDQRRRSEDAMKRFGEERASLASEISKIKCPTLIVRGARSDVLSDESAARFAKSLPNGRTITIENAGHNVQGDNPRALLDAVLRFFAEC